MIAHYCQVTSAFLSVDQMVIKLGVTPPKWLTKQAGGGFNIQHVY